MKIDAKLMIALMGTLAACGAPIETTDGSSGPRNGDGSFDATTRDGGDGGDGGVERDSAQSDSDGASSDGDSAIDRDGEALGADVIAAQDAQDASDASDTGVALMCPAGRANCNGVFEDGCETALDSVRNCGACGNECPTGPRATATCGSGRCAIRCERGYADCDGDVRNGCEVALDSSTEHCGACRNRCAGGANGSPVCAGGLCGVACNAGYSDCDRSLSNGCEIALATTVAHCGRCDNACTAPSGGSPLCSGGSCDFVCDPSLLRCGAQCVRRDDPAFGCGTCAACPLAPNATSMRCAAGGCAPATCAAGYKLCGSQCVAINDPAYGCQATSCSACALSTGAASMRCNASACEINACAAGYKRCGSVCASLTDPRSGCSSASCAACSPQNAAAICNASGGCDYATCNTGWRDLDGDRANGCETAAPTQVSGLRVWLSVREPGSLNVVGCAAGWPCTTRWNNLVDSSNPAVPTGGTPFVWYPNADGTARSVLINMAPRNPPQNPVAARTGTTSLSIGLSAVVNGGYTVFIVDSPAVPDRAYPLACRAESIFDTNGAFHVGHETDSQLRLGHFNNDLNIPATTNSTGWTRVLIAQQGLFGPRTLTRTDLSGTISGGDANTTLITRATNCSIGRGLYDDAQYSGHLHEVLVFGRSLNTTEINTVRTYLRRRYGI